MMKILGGHDDPPSNAPGIVAIPRRTFVLSYGSRDEETVSTDLINYDMAPDSTFAITLFDVVIVDGRQLTYLRRIITGVTGLVELLNESGITH